MNYILLILTIIVFGLFGGIINAIRTGKEKKEYWKALIKGVGAAFLVPVFLEIIKSELGRILANNLYDYVVFGGLCLVVAIFSDKFIDTLGDKVLQKAEKATQKAEESNRKINVIIEKYAEPEEAIAETGSKIHASGAPIPDHLKESVDKVIMALRHEKYKYRTISGIAKDTGLTPGKTGEILTAMEERKTAAKIISTNRTLWTLAKEP